ncbi:MAG TPA: hypothetical protein VFH54_06140 [Mycobacteriales bacterium]|nr:hypothetical protein [Mycobacteriales bacterium]
MAQIRNKTDEERYVPALRLLIGAGETAEVAEDALPGLLDQTETWELVAAAKPQPKSEGKE